LKAEAVVRLNSPPPRRTPEPFTLDWMRKYLPHYLANEPSLLHAELVADLATMRDARGQKKNRIAPRGSAKTTFGSKAFPLHGILEGYERFVLIESDSSGQAESILSAIKEELEGNAAIARDYPHAAGVGKVWQTAKIVTRNGAMVVAKGSGATVRGVTRGHVRPTLVILDDCNNDKEAYSEGQLTRKLDWLRKGILPIGEPGTNFLSVGTPIHRRAIPCELALDGGWETKSYRSIIEWPTRMDLWREWERLYTALSDPNRAATARAFYDANRADMDAGAVVLWPDRFPLYDLMCIRATVGDSAFSCEYQDTPGTPGATEWGPEVFSGQEFWVQGLPPKQDRIFTVQTLDASKGDTDRPGDWQAHVCLAYGRDDNLYFDADLRREDAHQMAIRACDLADIWKPDILAVENNGSMGLIGLEFDDLVKKGRLANVVLEVVTSTGSKAFRIRRAGPYLTRRRVRVVNGRGGRLLHEQWEQWPNAAHDDAPDAAGTAIHRLELAL
jgi:hypothetical protein